MTVTDGKGGAVTDLTAADFTVKEGGKDRDIVTTEPATARMQVSVLVEERLIGDGSIRMGIFEFMKRLHGAADIGLITVGIRNQTHVEHTGDLNTLAAALNKLSLNPGPQSNLTEGVLAVAQAIEQKKAPRPVIVAIALSGGQAGGPAANTVLTQLRQSGAIMHAVTLAGGGESAEGVGSLADSTGGNRSSATDPGKPADGATTCRLRLLCNGRSSRSPTISWRNTPSLTCCRMA